MKHAWAWIIGAAAAATGMAAQAGESPYTGPGSSPAANSARRACEPRVNEAERRLVYLPSPDPRRSEIVRELQYARAAIRDGQTDACFSHVQTAMEIEGYAAQSGPRPPRPGYYPGSPYGAYPGSPYGAYPGSPYGAPAPGYYRPYNGYPPGYYAPGYGVPNVPVPEPGEPDL